MKYLIFKKNKCIITKYNQYNSNKAELHKIYITEENYNQIRYKKCNVEIKIIINWKEELKKKQIKRFYKFNDFILLNKVDCKKNKKKNEYWILLDKDDIHYDIKKAQKRSFSGTDFENYICDEVQKGWERNSKSPKIIWNGEGENWVEKLKSHKGNLEEFYIKEESDYGKWDAIDKSDGHFKYEIKKYKKEKLRKGILYSEPIIKIATWKPDHYIYKEFNNNKQKYNQIIKDLQKTKWWKLESEYIKNEIASSSLGIQLEDAYVHNKDLDFEWRNVKGFEGFTRLSIFVKLK